MWKANRTLEVGCGPGRHSIMLAQTFLKEGGILVTSDFSKDMVQLMAENYKTSDYVLVENNKLKIDMESDFEGTD